MSIVVAVIKNKKTVVAADTLYLTGSQKDYAQNLMDRSKLVRAGSSVLGLTGWSLYQNIIASVTAKQRVPALKDEQAVFDFFLRFWKTLRDRYTFVKEQRESSDSPFSDLDSSFLVANRYGVFDVHGNLTVWRHRQFCAIGSGAPYALGALHALYERPGSARDLAQHAVEAAIRFDDACGGPIEVRDVSR